MRVRARDRDGDIMPVTRRESMLTDAAAVGQNIENSMHLLAGEWWEDDSIGFEVPGWLYDGVRASTGAEMLTSYITAFVADVEGVDEVNEVSGELVGHKYTYSCSIKTEFGDLEEEDFSDAILYAIS